MQYLIVLTALVSVITFISYLQKLLIVSLIILSKQHLIAKSLSNLISILQLNNFEHMADPKLQATNPCKFRDLIKITQALCLQHFSNKKCTAIKNTAVYFRPKYKCHPLIQKFFTTQN